MSGADSQVPASPGLGLFRMKPMGPTWTDSEVCFGCLAVMEQVQNRAPAGASNRDIIYLIRSACAFLEGDAQVFEEPCDHITHWDTVLASDLKKKLGYDRGTMGADGKMHYPAPNGNAFREACASANLCFDSMESK